MSTLTKLLDGKILVNGKEPFSSTVFAIMLESGRHIVAEIALEGITLEVVFNFNSYRHQRDIDFRPRMIDEAGKLKLPVYIRQVRNNETGETHIGERYYQEHFSARLLIPIELITVNIKSVDIGETVWVRFVPYNPQRLVHNLKQATGYELSQVITALATKYQNIASRVSTVCLNSDYQIVAAEVENMDAVSPESRRFKLFMPDGDTPVLEVPMEEDTFGALTCYHGFLFTIGTFSISVEEKGNIATYKFCSA